MTVPNESQFSDARGLPSVFVRWLLGAFLVYAGMSKALHPVEFLQSVRLYDSVEHPVALNGVAALLPWLEVFFGVLLIAGVAVRGVALLLIGLLILFTVLVVQRALLLQGSNGISFCAVRFDCGCGTGERFVCGKLAENLFLLVLSGALLRWSTDKWCAKYSLSRKPAAK